MCLVSYDVETERGRGNGVSVQERADHERAWPLDQDGRLRANQAESGPGEIGDSWPRPKLWPMRGGTCACAAAG